MPTRSQHFRPFGNYVRAEGDLRQDLQALRDNVPNISVDAAIEALALTGNNSADLMRIVDYAFDIVSTLGRNSAAQWAALDLIAARVEALESRA